MSQIHVPRSYRSQYSRYHPSYKLRPFSHRGRTAYDSWHFNADSVTPTRWAMIDVGELYYVTGIMLMGQYSENYYVQTFSLSYSSDDVYYTEYVNAIGEVKVNIKHGA